MREGVVDCLLFEGCIVKFVRIDVGSIMLSGMV